MRFHGSSGDLFSVLVSYPYVISAGHDMIIRIWNIESGQLEKELSGHKHLVKCLAHWTDNLQNIIISCSWDYNICIWSLETAKLIRTIAGHKNRVKTISITSGSIPLLVSYSDDKTIKVWDLFQGEEFLHIDNSISNSGNINVVAIYDGFSVAESTASTTSSSKTKQQIIDGVDVVIAAGCSDSIIRVWTRMGMICRLFHGHTAEVLSLAFTSDPVSQSAVLISGSMDHSIRIWDVKAGVASAVLRGHLSWVCGLTISTFTTAVTDSQGSSSSRAVLISGSSDGQIFLWDLPSRALITTLSTNGFPLIALAAPKVVNFNETAQKILQVQLQLPDSPTSPQQLDQQQQQEHQRSPSLPPMTDSPRPLPSPPKHSDSNCSSSSSHSNSNSSTSNGHRNMYVAVCGQNGFLEVLSVAVASLPSPDTLEALSTTHTTTFLSGSNKGTSLSPSSSTSVEGDGEGTVGTVLVSTSTRATHQQEQPATKKGFLKRCFSEDRRASAAASHQPLRLPVLTNRISGLSLEPPPPSPFLAPDTQSSRQSPLALQPLKHSHSHSHTGGGYGVTEGRKHVLSSLSLNDLNSTSTSSSISGVRLGSDISFNLAASAISGVGARNVSLSINPFTVTASKYSRKPSNPHHPHSLQPLPSHSEGAPAGAALARSPQKAFHRQRRKQMDGLSLGKSTVTKPLQQPESRVTRDQRSVMDVLRAAGMAVERPEGSATAAQGVREGGGAVVGALLSLSGSGGKCETLYVRTRASLGASLREEEGGGDGEDPTEEQVVVSDTLRMLEEGVKRATQYSCYSPPLKYPPSEDTSHNSFDDSPPHNVPSPQDSLVL